MRYRVGGDMTGEHAEDIGKLKADNVRTMENVDGLFRSNDKRKADINKLKIELHSIQHTVEETNQTANRVVEFMEELKRSVDDVKNTLSHMDGRITALENNKFDIVKILRWLGTTRGLIFMLVMIGVLNPASQDFLLELASRILGKST